MSLVSQAPRNLALAAWVGAGAWVGVGACVASVPPLNGAAGVDAGQRRSPPWPELELDEQGRGWRIHGGEFASADLGLRVRAGPGWRLMVGDEVPGVTPAVDVGLDHAEAGLTVIIERDVLVHGSLAEHGALRRESLWTALDVEEGPGVTAVEFAGQRIELVGARGASSYAYRYGLRAVGEDSLELVVRYPESGDPERAEQLLREALAGVEILDAAARERLRRELDQGPDPQNALGEDWSLRRGVYRNFAHDLVWEDSSGSWTVGARDAQVSVLLSVDNDSELFGLLSVREAVETLDAEGWHAFVLGALPGRPRVVAPQRRLPAGAGELVLDTLSYEQDGEAMLALLATVKHGELAAMWFIGGAEARARARLDQLEAVVAGLRVGVGLERLGQRDGLVLDHHAGFVLRPPPDATLDSVELGLGDWSAQRRWTSGADTVTVTVLSWSGSVGAGSAAQASLAREIEVAAGISSRAPAEAGPGQLAGHAGHQRSWTGPGGRDDLVIVNRDRTLYALHVHSEDPMLFERTRRSFEFID